MAEIAAGRIGLATLALREALEEPLTVAKAMEIDRLAQARGTERRTFRLAVLRSFTLEPVIPVLRAHASVEGIALEVRVGEYGAYAREILDPASWLYSEEFDAVLLAVQTRDFVPELWRGGGVDFEDLAATAAQQIAQWIDVLRSRCTAHLFVQGFEQANDPALGILDAQSDGQSSGIARLQRDLIAMARARTGVNVIDYDGIVARTGRENWYDERRYATARMPFTAAAINAYGRALWLHMQPCTGGLAKVLALDLDNTLWGGVVGEDGMAGIKLGIEYPGAGYQAVQRAALDLASRGVVLAICSKNNVPEAMQVIDEHPGMVLRRDAFACMEIHWESKAESLRRIARNLNVGLDAIAFLDDNPAERQLVALELPEVRVLPFHEDPFVLAARLRSHACFQRLALTREDAEKTRQYRENSEREELKASVGTLEDYYRSLDMVATIASVDSDSLQRVAQLTNKTNQFNLTTVRRTEAEVAALAGESQWICRHLRVIDRFGDNGIVAVGFVETNGETARIDTFLMSCRVIGRTVETAFLSQLAHHARAAGCTRMDGWYRPTEKNAPCSDFYQRHGFALAEDGPEGTLWSFDLTRDLPAVPDWIDLRTA